MKHIWLPQSTCLCQLIHRLADCSHIVIMNGIMVVVHNYAARCCIEIVSCYIVYPIDFVYLPLLKTDQRFDHKGEFHNEVLCFIIQLRWMMKFILCNRSIFVWTTLVPWYF